MSKGMIVMDEFRRRIYPNFGHFLKDVRFIRGNRKKMQHNKEDGTLSFAFRERLMLAVTSVNGCRYCSHHHARQAILSGVTKEETDLLLNGVIDHCPEEEAPAIFYAQHWAETDVNPDSEAREKLIETYGKEKAEAIELVLRGIRVGNLTGNTLDYILYRISFGRLGLTDRDEETGAKKAVDGV